MASDCPLDDAFASARRSETLLTRLCRLGEKGEVRSVDLSKVSERLKVRYECGRRGHVNEDWEREATNHEGWSLWEGQYIATPGVNGMCVLFVFELETR